MKFSFVVPVYNVENYLKGCIQSILCQTYKNLEIILVDDCSSDGSETVCDELAKSDIRVRTIHKKNNEGPGMARNTGIKCATGDYIIFCDADDFYSDCNFLSSVAARISKDTDIVVFNYSILYGSKTLPARKCISELSVSYSTGQEYLRAALDLRYDYRWYSWLYVFNKALFDKGIVFPQERLGEDTATIYKLILGAKEIEVEKNAFYVYRMSSGNHLASVKSYDVFAGIIDVAKRCINNVLRMDRIDQALKKALCNNFVAAYYTALLQTDNLQGDDFEKLINLLEREKKVADYATSPKQVTARMLIRFLGLKTTAKILGIRRRVRDRKNGIPGIKINRRSLL